ncbi:alpha-glycosidase [Marinicrinis sediminis]|uniref:Alpha-glycosidase n=1 Tax=Marinicrinis sediminis TaxID=1652465 RepID=A0ABW5RF22_9BACL
MLIEAIYHRPKLNWAYSYDERTVHLRLRTKRADIDKVEVFYGDKCLPWEEMQTVRMEKLAEDEWYDYWETAVQPPYRRLCYAFILQDGDASIWYSEEGFHRTPPVRHLGLFEFPFINAADINRPPAWVKDAIFYQIFPERFANGDPSNDPADVQPWGNKPEQRNFFGGDLQGIIDHLDHLTELGITALYLTPIFAGETNHKYDTSDYMQIDSHFGTKETLKQLVDACHEKGIRVMLDAVFNHAGKAFAPFKDVMENGPASRYADWFHVREWPATIKDGRPTYDTFAFEPLMPKLKTEHPEVKQYLLNVAKYWIEECGIDGWRLDVANEVDHKFWRAFRDVVKEVNPEAYILGEIWHDSVMWLQGDQFDGVMNYPLSNTMLDFFVFGHLDAQAFANKIGGLLARYPKPANEACFNQLDSHDTVRLITLCKENTDMMKLALLFQFSFPGAPSIYYGDEIGLTGEFDPDNRKCMPWNEEKQDRSLFAYYQQLIQLRKTYGSLRSGTLRFLHAEQQSTGLIYERSDQSEKLIILMNAGEQAQTLSVRLEAGAWSDALTGDSLPVSDGVYTENLPPYGARVIVKGAR